MQQIIDYLNNIVSNDIYKEDFKTINEIISILNAFVNDPENITVDLLDCVDDKIKYLDQKYNDLYDLVNMYNPLKFECKSNLHKRYVTDLRKENRLKKEGRKNEI